MGSSGNGAAQAAIDLQNKQQANINTGMGQIAQAFSGYTPQFYQQRATDYQNFALPQLTAQAQQQQSQLGYGLARRGLLKSDTANRQSSILGQNINQQKRGIVDSGQQQAQSLEQQVNQSKSNLIGQLQTANDPSAIGGQALNVASQFSAPSTFAPIGNLFGTYANIYAANQLAQAYAPVLQQGQQQVAAGGAALPPQTLSVK